MDEDMFKETVDYDDSQIFKEMVTHRYDIYMEFALLA